MNRACFPKEKTPEFTKKGEIHELFVLDLSLVWFAGATPDSNISYLWIPQTHQRNSPFLMFPIFGIPRHTSETQSGERRVLYKTCCASVKARFRRTKVARKIWLKCFLGAFGPLFCRHKPIPPDCCQISHSEFPAKRQDN